MSRTIQALATLLPVGYLLLTFLYGMALGGPRAPRPEILRRLVLGAVLLLHLAYFGCLWAAVGHFPVADRWTAVSMLSLGLVLVYLPVELATRNVSTGVFVTGAAFALQLLDSAFGLREPRASRLSENVLFEGHVASVVAAVAALLLSGFYGALYLILLRQMRRKTFGVLYAKLPDLDTLSRMNRGAAFAGFLLMSAGLNLGIAWAHGGGVDPGTFSYLDPKVLAAMVTWIVFGIIGASRWIHLLSGRRAAWVAVGGFILVVFTFSLSFVPFATFHSFD